MKRLAMWNVAVPPIDRERVHSRLQGKGQRACGQGWEGGGSTRGGRQPLPHAASVLQRVPPMCIPFRSLRSAKSLSLCSLPWPSVSTHIPVRRGQAAAAWRRGRPGVAGILRGYM